MAALPCPCSPHAVARGPQEQSRGELGGARPAPKSIRGGARPPRGLVCTEAQTGSTGWSQLCFSHLAPDFLSLGGGGRGKLNPEVIGAKAKLGLKDISRVPPLIYFFGKQEAGFSFHPKPSQNVAVFIAAFIYLFLAFVGNRRVCS